MEQLLSLVYEDACDEETYDFAGFKSKLLVVDETGNALSVAPAPGAGRGARGWAVAVVALQSALNGEKASSLIATWPTRATWWQKARRPARDAPAIMNVNTSHVLARTSWQNSRCRLKLEVSSRSL